MGLERKCSQLIPLPFLWPLVCGPAAAIQIHLPANGLRATYTTFVYELDYITK